MFKNPFRSTKKQKNNNNNHKINNTEVRKYLEANSRPRPDLTAEELELLGHHSRPHPDLTAEELALLGHHSSIPAQRLIAEELALLGNAPNSNNIRLPDDLNIGNDSYKRDIDKEYLKLLGVANGYPVPDEILETALNRFKEIKKQRNTDFRKYNAHIAQGKLPPSARNIISRQKREINNILIEAYIKYKALEKYNKTTKESIKYAKNMGRQLRDQSGMRVYFNGVGVGGKYSRKKRRSKAGVGLKSI